jgi:hypothetical protein
MLMFKALHILSMVATVTIEIATRHRLGSPSRSTHAAATREVAPSTLGYSDGGCHAGTHRKPYTVPASEMTQNRHAGSRTPPAWT